MEHNTGKEQWMDEVMSSMQGAQRAQPAVHLYERVTERLRNHHATEKPQPILRWAAAAALLIALNAGSLIYYSTQLSGTKNQVSNPLSRELQSVTTYNY